MSDKLNIFRRVRKKILLNSKVFTPNLTTELSFKTADKFIKNSYKILDLGCGSGILGIAIKISKKNIELNMSDVDKRAYYLTKKNLKLFKIRGNVKCGSLFAPWKYEKFDYIINDVSGISQKVSIISPWFKNIPCFTGDDGTLLTIKVLNEAYEKLNQNGILQIPVLSLSKSKKILDFAKKKYKKVIKCEEQKWALPESMYKHEKILKKLKKKRLIDFDYQFNKIICKTTIIIAIK